MINIRNNCFETNSSSMHSLVISKQAQEYDEDELRFGYDAEYDKGEGFKLFDHCWNYDDYTFGRAPFRILRTPREKLRYWVGHELGNWRNLEDVDPLKIEQVKKLISMQTGLPFDKINLYANIHELENPGCDRKGNPRKIEPEYGYAEENDTGESVFHFIHRKGIEFADLILNPKYTIVVDGDEYQIFKDMCLSGVVDVNSLEDISSTKDYWTNSIRYVYVNWFDNDFRSNYRCDKDKNFDDEHIINDNLSHIDSSTKEIALLVDLSYDDEHRNDVECYKENLGRIRKFFDKVKELYPNVTTAIHYTYIRCAKNDNYKYLETPKSVDIIRCFKGYSEPWLNEEDDDIDDYN